MLNVFANIRLADTAIVVLLVLPVRTTDSIRGGSSRTAGVRLAVCVGGSRSALSVGDTTRTLVSAAA
eukprot:COSAG02_NODE_1643_length_11528_cov_19.259865_4_plen_67_part_00